MSNSNNRQLSSINFKNNCSKFSNNTNFVVDSNTNLINDKCYESSENKQNSNVNDYMLSNYASCNCDINNVLKTSTDNRGITIKDGYGISDCNVDKDSKLRQGKLDRHYKTDLQLFTRPYLTTPDVSKGKFKPNLESKLLNSQMIKRHKQMQYVSEKNVFTPLVPNLARNIQAPKNLIQEYVSKDWVRGGIPSRDTVKYLDYMNRSTDSDVIKQLLQKKTGWI